MDRQRSPDRASPGVRTVMRVGEDSITSRRGWTMLSIALRTHTPPVYSAHRSRAYLKSSARSRVNPGSFFLLEYSR